MLQRAQKFLRSIFLRVLSRLPFRQFIVTRFNMRTSRSRVLVIAVLIWRVELSL
jgi:hypothetical protein